MPACCGICCRRVSDTRILIKASFNAPLADAPTLHVGGTAVHGRMGDTRGEYWHFYATDLKPGRPYRLSLAGDNGRRALRAVGAFDLSRPRRTAGEIPPAASTPAPGGHEVHKFLPTATRNRLLRRALSFAPQAVIANGDHVYWDLLAPVGNDAARHVAGGIGVFAGTFDRSAVVLGGDNETVLKRAAGPQIVPVYGTDFRSTPVFFMQDDHDYFDNDEATDEIVTFPPS